jgi:hypothetical protein
MSGQTTPGPWEQIGEHGISASGELVEDDRSTSITESIVIANPDEPEMAIVVLGINYPNNWDENLLEANARLIALCPEMLEYIESSATNGCATAQGLISKITGAA